LIVPIVTGFAILVFGRVGGGFKFYVVGTLRFPTPLSLGIL